MATDMGKDIQFRMPFSLFPFNAMEEEINFFKKSNPTNTSIPCFLKVCIMPLHFYERSTSVRALANQKIWREFSLLQKKKGEKQKLHSVFVLQWAFIEAAHTQSWVVRMAWPSSFPGTIFSISSSSHQSFGTVCEHLCFIHILCIH